MDPKEMTLDQLMEANPAAFVEHAERLSTEPSVEGAEEPPKVTETVGLTREDVLSVVTEAFGGFKTEIMQEIGEGFKTRDQADNRVVLNQILTEEKDLPKATKERIRREFHDVTFDATEASDDQPAKTGLERFIERVKEYITECRAELKEATESITTTVDDGGASGELVVTETGRQSRTTPGAHDMLMTRLGQAKPAVVPATNGKAESDASESQTEGDEPSPEVKDS